MLITFVTTMGIVVRKCGGSAAAAWISRDFLLPPWLLELWEIIRALVPVFIALAQQQNSAIIVASSILSCTTVLSIILKNFQLFQMVWQSTTSLQSIKRSQVAPDDVDATLGEKPKVNFVKDKFHAEFIWNANQYNDKKDARHRV